MLDTQLSIQDHPAAPATFSFGGSCVSNLPTNRSESRRRRRPIAIVWIAALALLATDARATSLMRLYGTNGSPGWVTVPYHPATRPVDRLSVELQIEYADMGNPISCTHYGGWNFTLDSRPGDIAFQVRLGGQYVGASFDASLAWTPPFRQVVGTYDGEQVAIWMDGQLMDAVPASGPIEYSVANSLFIGAEAGSGGSPDGHCAGLDYRGIRLWNVALSAVEQNFYRDRWTDSQVDGLVCSWQFTGDAHAMLQDTGPHGLHGTYHGNCEVRDVSWSYFTAADRLFGRVTDGVFRDALAGAQVTTGGLGDRVANADGFWSLSNPWGSREIGATLVDWQPWSRAVAIPSGTTFLAVNSGLVPLCIGGALHDAFDDSALPGWRPAPDQSLTSLSNWAQSGGELVQTTNANGPGDWPLNSGTRLVREDACWDDTYLLARVKPVDDDVWGVEWRLRDLESQATGLRAQFRQQDGPGAALLQALDGQWTVLHDLPGQNVSANAWHWIEVESIGDAVQIRLDGAPCLDGTAAEAGGGRVALWCAAQQGMRWDDVAIVGPPSDGVGAVGSIAGLGLHSGPDGNDHTRSAGLLGHPDGSYLSLGGDCQGGNPGNVVVALERWVALGEGPELLLVELGDDEPWRLLVGVGPWGPWTQAAEGVGTALVDLEPGGLDLVHYVQIQDRSTDCGGTSPGVDLDAILSLRHGEAPPPQQPILSIERLMDWIRLSWDPVPGAAFYRVYRLPTPWADLSQGTLLDMTPMTEFEDWEAMLREQSWYVVTVEY